MDAAIEGTINTVDATRERPRLSALLRHVAADCHAAGLLPPSLKALRARVSARDLR